MIVYGNLEGAYFSQAAIDHVMVPLANEIMEKLGVETVNVYYDAIADFSHCLFEVNGHRVDIKYYKIFGTTIDGKELCCCPVYQQWELVRIIREKVKS
jgi:hypothetical protein